LFSLIIHFPLSIIHSLPSAGGAKSFLVVGTWITLMKMMGMIKNQRNHSSDDFQLSIKFSPRGAKPL